MLLEAQVAAFPLSSVESFERGILDLGRDPSGLLDDSTRRLAADLEQWIRLRAGGLSVESISQLRDGVWFSDGRRQASITAHAIHVAAQYLSVRGPSTRLCSDAEDECLVAARWRWLSLLVPGDLLVAACHVGSSDGPPGDHVDLTSDQLSRVLQGPVAQTHLHVGAAASFSLLWTGLMGALRGGSPSAPSLERSPGPLPFQTGQRFLRGLRLAAIARIVMASYLWELSVGRRDRSFDEFLGRRSDAGPSGLGRIAANLGWPWGSAQAHDILRDAVGSLMSGAEGALPLPVLGDLYRRLCGPQRWRRRRLGSVVETDPLADWLSPAGRLVLPEMRFTALAIAHMSGCERRRARDTAFERLFWQYQRVRCLLYRHLVQEPGTAGLDWFGRFYGRLAPFRGALESYLFEGALELESNGVNLASLEVRTSPAPSWTSVRDLVRQLADQARSFVPRPGLAAPEVGLVLHFIKSSTTGEGKARRALADPRHRTFRTRYGPWFFDREREAGAIATLLACRPDFLVVLRGLDVASTELAIPTWVTAPILSRLREVSIRAARRLRDAMPEAAVPGFRQTLHAGEDYRRLCEGLRRIHEPIEFGLVRMGDRFGHAVALGEECRTWRLTHPVIYQPRDERLDDLLWELDRYQRADWHPTADRLEMVRASAVRLARAIYPDAPDVDTLVEARRLRHLPEVLAHLGYPMRVDLARSHGDRALRYVAQHLADPQVFEAGAVAIPVETHDSEVAMLETCQAWLRDLLGRREITVEVNPTSNLLIGGLGGFEDHPLFRLNEISGDAPGDGLAVLASINDDDPVVFSTRLADEFAYVYASLLRRNVPAPRALAFVDTVRENGWRSRFTVPESRDLGVLAKLRPFGRPGRSVGVAREAE